MTFTLTTSVELHGTLPVLAMGGVVVGLLFGFFAQRSRFCLRAAVIDVWRGRFAARLGVWLLAFGSAVLAVQTLVLSANGNLRALLSGLVFAVTAQAALGGVLSPWRVEIASWWMVDGGSARSLLGRWGAGAEVGIALGLVWLAAGVWFSLRAGNRFWQWVGGLGTGLAVALAWYFTYAVSQASFDPVTVSGLTFSGPSAQWLMRVLHSPAPPFDFDAGMLPAVFVGSALGALLQREFKIEGFHNGLAMLRYISGAMAMGFGSVLAGGCAVGAGMTGGAIFSLTAWLALVGMWLGGGLMDRLLPEPP
jgi:hypothetical protein